MRKIRGLKNIEDVMKFSCSCCCQKLVKKQIKIGKCKYCSIHCWYYLKEENNGNCLKRGYSNSFKIIEDEFSNVGSVATKLRNIFQNYNSKQSFVNFKNRCYNISMRNQKKQSIFDLVPINWNPKNVIFGN